MFFQAQGTSGNLDRYLTTIKNTGKQSRFLGWTREMSKQDTCKLHTPIRLSKQPVGFPLSNHAARQIMPNKPQPFLEHAQCFVNI